MAGALIIRIGFQKRGGAVISTTINKYCYISCRYLPPFFQSKHRVIWSHIELVSTLNEILHPAVREGLKFLGFTDKTGMEIHYQGDLPARTGMGSSSSFAVGLLKALHALKGQMISKHELGLQAIELEQKILKENVGCQDQVAAAYGGFNLIQFNPNGSIQVEPITIAEERLENLQERLLLFYTGTSRIASQVAGELIANVGKNKETLRKMRAMVNQALTILSDHEDLDHFGDLLNESWQYKRSLSSSISNLTIDNIYELAMKNGALGGKLLGAGASGFMVFYAPVETHEGIKEALKGYLQVPFRFEFDGSSIIHYRPNE